MSHKKYFIAQQKQRKLLLSSLLFIFIYNKTPVN
jgi:hypothetical protein